MIKLFPNRDKWVKNDHLLIILTSENTTGAMVGNITYAALPNSRMVIGVGPIEDCIPDTNDYFEECRGFYPDLWVPAAEAEELAVKLLEKNAW